MIANNCPVCRKRYAIIRAFKGVKTAEEYDKLKIKFEDIPGCVPSFLFKKSKK